MKVVGSVSRAIPSFREDKWFWTAQCFALLAILMVALSFVVLLLAAASAAAYLAAVVGLGGTIMTLAGLCFAAGFLVRWFETPFEKACRLLKETGFVPILSGARHDLCLVIKDEKGNEHTFSHDGNLVTLCLKGQLSRIRGLQWKFGDSDEYIPPHRPWDGPS
jgi:hypothetical protein